MIYDENFASQTTTAHTHQQHEKTQCFCSSEMCYYIGKFTNAVIKLSEGNTFSN